jgi:hypothetical protein
MTESPQDVLLPVMVQRITRIHGWILQAVEPLSEDELCHRPARTAPPIGWHLWHIARWTDRVQASLPRRDDPPGYAPNPNQGIWEREQLAARWDLDPSTLGTLEEGSAMDFELAAQLPRRIGREALLVLFEAVAKGGNRARSALGHHRLWQRD